MSLIIIAYIDPGSGSVIFQMLIAGMLSMGYLGRKYVQNIFGKLKSLFKK